MKLLDLKPFMYPAPPFRRGGHDNFWWQRSTWNAR